MTERKVFRVPHGSEDICNWCKKDRKCDYYEKGNEVTLVVYGVPAKVKVEDLARVSQLRTCSMFEPDESKLPDDLKGCKIIVR